MATVSFRHVRTEHRHNYVRVIIDRSARYNALDSLALRSLVHLLDRERHQTLPLVLEGDGSVFSVGADINELASLGAQEAHDYSQLGHAVLAALEAWPGVTIAKLSGFVLGAGLELALGCDVLLGAHDVRLGLPGLAWALVPCMGGLRRLACRASEQFSSDLFLNGDVLDAERALAHRLIDRVIASDQEAYALAIAMSEYSPSAVRAIRSLRLDRHGMIDADIGARMFSQPFVSGECQKRLRGLLAG